MVEKIFHKCSCGQGCFIQIPSYVYTKIIKDILSDVETRNPYPEDRFIEPSKEDWALLNSICRINGKMSESFMMYLLMNVVILRLGGLRNDFL